LELFRESQITLEQEAPLKDLYIKWVGSNEGDISVTDEFDQETQEKSNVVDLGDRND
jgi:segregation and condensation protein A